MKTKNNRGNLHNFQVIFVVIVVVVAASLIIQLMLLPTASLYSQDDETLLLVDQHLSLFEPHYVRFGYKVIRVCPTLYIADGRMIVTTNEDVMLVCGEIPFEG